MFPPWKFYHFVFLACFVVYSGLLRCPPRLGCHISLAPQQGKGWQEQIEVKQSKYALNMSKPKASKNGRKLISCIFYVVPCDLAQRVYIDSLTGSLIAEFRQLGLGFL